MPLCIVPEHFPVYCPVRDKVFETLDPGVSPDGKPWEGWAVEVDGITYATAAYVADQERRRSAAHNDVEVA